MEEKIIYKSPDISVTSSKIVIFGNTYLVKDLSDARAVKVPNYASIALLIVALVAGAGSLANFKDAWYILLLSAAMLYAVRKWQLSYYRVQLDTPSGTVNVYKGEKVEMLAIKTVFEKAIKEAAAARRTQLA